MIDGFRTKKSKTEAGTGLFNSPFGRWRELKRKHSKGVGIDHKVKDIDQTF